MVRKQSSEFIFSIAVTAMVAGMFLYEAVINLS